MPATEAAGAAVAQPAAILLHVMLALAAILVVGHGLGRLFARFDQPPVIGEIVAGIVLGPSVVGAAASARLLPPDAAPYLGVIAQLGVVLYMFLVGIELDLGALRQRRSAVGLVAALAMTVPFALGAGLAVALHDRFAPDGVPVIHFAMFVGVAMSVTAFPVLARILTDSGLADTDIGRLALGAAALGDVAAWCMLAVVVGIATARPSAALSVAGLAIAFAAVVVGIVRPALRRWLVPGVRGVDMSPRGGSTGDGDEPPPGALTVLLVLALVGAAATEAIGIHALFGAFLIGAVVPHDTAVARALPRQLGPVVTGLLLPAFFAYTGMRTHIGLVAGLDLWLITVLVIAVAAAGKLGGTMAAARLAGLGWRDGAVLGALMNTRGLMELIVLGVGLDLGILSPTLFAVMVLMALATTMMTGPAVRRLLRPGGV